MGNLSKFCSLAQVLHAQACAGVLTVMWGAVGIDGEGNFNLNLSLPDSGWLRFEVKIYWGLDLGKMQLVGAPNSYRPIMEA